MQLLHCEGGPRLQINPGNIRIAVCGVCARHMLFHITNGLFKKLLLGPAADLKRLCKLKCCS